jgi:hypothetical protein
VEKRMLENTKPLTFFEIIPSAEKCVCLVNLDLVKEENHLGVIGYIQLKVDEFFDAKNIKKRIFTHPNGSPAHCYFVGEKNIFQRILSNGYMVITLSYFDFHGELMTIITSAVSSFIHAETFKFPGN